MAIRTRQELRRVYDGGFMIRVLVSACLLGEKVRDEIAAMLVTAVPDAPAMEPMAWKMHQCRFSKRAQLEV
jgi:hypothetical protein